MEATAILEDKVRDISSYDCHELYDKDILKSLVEDLPERAKTIEYRTFVRKYKRLLTAVNWRKKDIPGLIDKVQEAIAGSVDYTIRRIEENGGDLNAMHIRQNYRTMYNAVLKLGYVWEEYLEKLGIDYSKHAGRREINPSTDPLEIIGMVKKLPEEDLDDILKNRSEKHCELLRMISKNFESPQIALILADRENGHMVRPDVLRSAVREYWGKLGKSQLELYNLIDNAVFRNITDRFSYRDITPDIRPELHASTSRVYSEEVAGDTMYVNLNLVAGNRTIINGKRKRDGRIYYDTMIDFRLVDEKFTPKAIDAAYMIGTSLTKPCDLFAGMEDWLKRFGFRLD